MKTKLLRKIHKRFEIKYFPNKKEMILYDYRTQGVLAEERLILYLGTDRYNSNWCGERTLKDFPTANITEWNYENAFKFLKSFLQDIVLQEYSQYGTRRNKIASVNTKIWHNV